MDDPVGDGARAWILAVRSEPIAIGHDNEPEFTSRYFLAWCLERGIELIHIEPGKPV